MIFVELRRTGYLFAPVRGTRALKIQPIQQQQAGVWRSQAREQGGQRGLSSAGRTFQQEPLSSANPQITSVQNGAVAVAENKVVSFDERLSVLSAFVFRFTVRWVAGIHRRWRLKMASEEVPLSMPCWPQARAYSSVDPSMLNIREITCNNNGAPDGIRSLVRFNAVAGTDHLVAVDGVGGAKGTISLNWWFGRRLDVTVIFTNMGVREGGGFELRVSAFSYTPDLRYQWRLNGVDVLGRTNDAYSDQPRGGHTSYPRHTHPDWPRDFQRLFSCDWSGQPELCHRRQYQLSRLGPTDELFWPRRAD